MNPSEVKEEILNLMDEAGKTGCRKSALSRRLGIGLRTVQNWRKKGFADRRKGAVKHIPNKLSENERSNALKTACSPRFMNLTPFEIVPILAEEGTYICSESTFYRLLSQQKLVRPKKSRRRYVNEFTELKADRPNQLWSWDITYLKTVIRGVFHYLYLIADVYSRAIVGWEIHSEEDGILASSLVRRICEERGIAPSSLVLHSDNGSPMRCGTMLATLQALGVVSSFSRPRMSNDNAYSEALFKTLKYTAGYPGSFESIDDARDWMTRFEKWYNTEHRHSGISYVTPEQRHSGSDIPILEARRTVYEAARSVHPERWRGTVRKWLRLEIVWLKKPNLRTKCA